MRHHERAAPAVGKAGSGGGRRGRRSGEPEPCHGTQKCSAARDAARRRRAAAARRQKAGKNSSSARTMRAARTQKEVEAAEKALPARPSARPPRRHCYGVIRREVIPCCGSARAALGVVLAFSAGQRLCALAAEMVLPRQVSRAVFPRQHRRGRLPAPAPCDASHVGRVLQHGKQRIQV